ncbi:MAG: CBS domain-containing protein [Proteobacteria bacterium]|nr:CBS domain-containing protein [Pseudomonadota bacterium]
MMRLRDILKDKDSTLYAIDGDADIKTAARKLTDHRIGAMVILDKDDHLQGILSERDISKAVGSDDSAATAGPVSSIMTRDVITCHPDYEISELFQIMVDNNIRHLPVLENDRVVGMLSIRDISRALVQRYESENLDMKNLIVALNVNAA